MSKLFDEKADSTLTVSDLTRIIKAALKAELPGRIVVRGEASNVRWQGAGHFYFTLKDRGASLPMVMFNSAAAKLKFTPENGQELLATGAIDLYEPHGKYQFNATRLEPVGEGALELARRQLEAKLSAEGLFEPGRRRAVPKYPRVIVIVSSRNAAGYQDILKVFARHRHLDVFLLPVAVQGKNSASEVSGALRALSPYAGRMDVVLLCRGGGSKEDLASFSEESVVRAVSDCRVPIATGIGHQTDVSLADLAADHHAHTPTAAAEYVTRHWEDAPDLLDNHRARLNVAVRDSAKHARQRLREMARHELFRRPTDLVDHRRQRLDDFAGRLVGGLRDAAQSAERRLGVARRRVESVHPRHQIEKRQHNVEATARQLAAATQRRLTAATERLARAEHRLDRLRPEQSVDDRRRVLADVATKLNRAFAQRHAAARRELVDVQRRLPAAQAARLATGRRQLEVVRARLQALNPTAVLARGFTLTRRGDGTLVRRVGDVAAGDEVTTVTSDGEIRSRVEG